MSNNEFIIVDKASGKMYDVTGNVINGALMPKDNVVDARYVFVKDINNKEDVELRIAFRQELIKEAFGDATVSDVTGFAWTIEDNYIKPSEQIMRSSCDPVHATTVYLVYKAWQESCSVDENINLMYIASNIYERGKGYPLGVSTISKWLYASNKTIAAAISNTEGFLRRAGKDVYGFGVR